MGSGRELTLCGATYLCKCRQCNVNSFRKPRKRFITMSKALRISVSSTDHRVAACTSTRTQPWLVPLECRTRLFPVSTGLGEKCTPEVLKATGEEARLGTRPGSKAYFSSAIVQGQVCAGDVRCTGDTSQQVHLPSPTNDLIIGACNGQRWGRSLQAACH